MSTEIAIIEDITEEKWPEVYGVGKVNSFYEKVKAHVSQEVPDVSTAKGRAAIASNSGKVSSSKTAVEKPGRDYLRKIKELPKTIETELREFVTAMDKLRDDTRQPLTDWEAEQARIKAEKEAEAAIQALLIQIESDHEIALLLNEKFDREAAEAKAAAEEARIQYEAKIAANAAEIARQELLFRQEQERRDAQLVLERAQREKAESEAREKQSVIDAAARELKLKQDAELATKLAAEQAERDRVQAIEDERAKVAAENKRLADIKAAEDLAAKKLSDNKANQQRKKTAAKESLIALGLTEDVAVDVVKAIIRGDVAGVTLTF